MTINLEKFSAILASGFAPLLQNQKSIAVGVSGGPDSMALCKLLSHWSQQFSNAPQIHALTLDHGLRPESAGEAKQVGEWVSGWPKITHHVLRWEGEKPESRIMETARTNRYQLLEKESKRNGANRLFLAHHQDDQAETFLFRLSKGSGLDGLAAMMPAQNYSSDFILMRPLLQVSKEDLLAFCAAEQIPFIEDPSNENENYARPRLRKAKAVLEEEGLSAKRLSVTAQRLARARHALEEMADMAMQDMVTQNESGRVVLNFKTLRAWPGEIGLRVLLKVFDRLSPDKDYGPRLEKVETLFEELMLQADFRKRTLGGVIIERDDKAALVILTPEH